MAVPKEMQDALKKYQDLTKDKRNLNMEEIAQARDEILRFIGENYGKVDSKLLQNDVKKAIEVINSAPERSGVKNGYLFELPNGGMISAEGYFYTNEQLMQMKEEEKQKQLLSGDFEFPEKDEFGPKGYVSEVGTSYVNDAKKKLNEKTRRGRLVGGLVIAGAAAVALVSGGVAIPALAAAGGAFASLGASAAGVAVGLGVTGVSTLVAVGAASVMTARGIVNSRDPEILKYKYDRDYGKHVQKMGNLETKLANARNNGYTSKASIKRIEKRLAKEMEKGLRIDKAYATKVNKQIGRLEKMGALTGWLADHGVERFETSNDYKLGCLSMLRQSANNRVADNLRQGLRLNDKFQLDLMSGKNAQQILNRNEKTGLYGKAELFGTNRTVAEYDAIHSKIIEDSFNAHPEKYGKLGSWNEVVEAIRKEVGFEGDLPPRTAVKLMLSVQGDKRISEQLKGEAKALIIKSPILKDAVQEMRESGSYDSDLAKLLKNNEKYFTGEQPEHYDSTKEALKEEPQNVDDWEKENKKPDEPKIPKSADIEVVQAPGDEPQYDESRYNTEEAKEEALQQYNKDHYDWAKQQKEYEKYRKDWQKSYDAWNDYDAACKNWEQQRKAVQNAYEKYADDNSLKENDKVIKTWAERKTECIDYDIAKEDYEQAIQEVDKMNPVSEPVEVMTQEEKEELAKKRDAAKKEAEAGPTRNK